MAPELSKVGRREDALATTDEAAKNSRRLVAALPAQFLSPVEVVNQRERIAELLGQIAALQGEWTDADVVRITSANVALQREVRALTAERDRLTGRLAAARDNARFADKRIAALEAQLAEQITAPPA